ncbi:MAG: hypothetical protein ACK6DA_02865 [Candidatus Kapaibacterium sp.]
MISEFFVAFGILVSTALVQDEFPPLPVPSPVVTQDENIQDGLFDKILESIRQESKTQRALLGLISSRIIEIDERLQGLTERDNFQPLRNQIEELKKILSNLELKPDFQPIRNLVEEVSNKVDELFNKNELERARVLDKIRQLFDDRLASLKDINDRLNLLPNLIEQITQERERRRLIDIIVERIDARQKNIEERLNSVDLRLRPLEALANWIHKIINGIFYIALKIFGVIIGILLGLALIRAVFARLFPELYSKIASTIKFIFMIP